MSYTPLIRVFLLDDNGNKMSCKDAERLLVADGLKVTDKQIRHHISANNATTIQDIRDIKKRIKEEGKMWSRKMHMTKYGNLSLRDIHARHPYKENLKITALSSRIATHGAMNEKIWEDVARVGVRIKTKKKKTCGCCGKIRKRKFFKEIKKTSDGLSEQCVDCGDVVTDIKTNGSSTKKKRLTVKPGQYVRSKKGLLYQVKECHSNGKGVQADLYCLRVMEDTGQVLKRKTWRIEGGWSLAEFNGV